MHTVQIEHRGTKFRFTKISPESPWMFQLQYVLDDPKDEDKRTVMNVELLRVLDRLIELLFPEEVTR